MAKKKFEEEEYDPFTEEARRNLARQVSAPLAQASAPTSASVNTAPASEPTRVANMPVSRNRFTLPETPALTVANPAKGITKARTFKCASATQDKELDAFIVRLEEASSTSVPFQVIARAAIAATMRSEEQIVELIRRNPPQRRPANVSAAEYAQFEQFWMDIVMEALRKVRPYQ